VQLKAKSNHVHRPLLLFTLFLWTLSLPAVDLIDDLNTLPIVDEVKLGDIDPGHRFTELPTGCSTVVSAGGANCRVLANQGQAKMMAVRLGEGRNLIAKATYVLEVEYPEDAPRTFFIANRGDDSSRGVVTGPSLPECLHQFTNSNGEILDLPLSGKTRTWRSMFRLHDRSGGIVRARDAGELELNPADGFWVIISQSEHKRLPGSHGAAVATIRLRAVAEPEKFWLPLRRPPANMPQRHIFWREEMSDGIITSLEQSKRACNDPLDWYAHKIATMRFLGQDAFSKDLLEFGHNQGWDSSLYGGNEWVYQSKTPERWQKIVALMGKNGIPILPYYEYSGSVGNKGFGKLKRAETLSGKPTYTHIEWTEKANVDITDPETADDLGKILDCTIFRLKDQATFLGAWLRPRPSFMPIGFADATRERFATEVNSGAAISREQLRGDKNLRERYYSWWFDKRRDFLVGIQKRLVTGGVANPVLIFTAHTGEPVPDIGRNAVVVRGDPEPWRRLFIPDNQKTAVRTYDEVVSSDAYLTTLLAQPSTWGEWEWQHCQPQADPVNYAKVPGILLSYPYNRAYTVASSKALEAFRGPAGLVAIRHHPLNETCIPADMIGYFCADMELSGPACVLSDVMAMANGDPTMLGTLTGQSLVRGFPEYVRPFNAAFLALPALPSTRMDNAASSSDVTVRSIDGGKAGVWLSVAHVGLTNVSAVKITLPAGIKHVEDAATGVAITVVAGTITMDLAACCLRALHCTR